MSLQSVPILMYHQVTPHVVPPSFRKYTVTPRAFAAQMGWLWTAGYRPVTLDRLEAARLGASPLPRRAVVITFDDGFRDCVEYALPILEARGFTAVFFLVAGLMGGLSRWLRGERGCEFPLMDWATARHLQTSGFQCGAHSLTHPRLTQLSAAECRIQLAESRQCLEDGLGVEVRHVAYPFGEVDACVRTLTAESGFRTGCTVQPGLWTAASDPLDLPRVLVGGDDSLLDFICRLHTAVALRETARGLLSRTWRRLRREGSAAP